MSHIELWAEFPDTEIADIFEVSNFGRIRDSSSLDIIPWQYRVAYNGTRYGGISISGPRITLAPGLTYRIPWVVLEAFCGKRPEGAFALHRNDNRLDNRYPENLYWGSSVDNAADYAINRNLKRYCCSLPDKLSPLTPF